MQLKWAKEFLIFESGHPAYWRYRGAASASISNGWNRRNGKIKQHKHLWIQTKGHTNTAIELVGSRAHTQNDEMANWCNKLMEYHFYDCKRDLNVMPMCIVRWWVMGKGYGNDSSMKMASVNAVDQTETVHTKYPRRWHPNIAIAHLISCHYGEWSLLVIAIGALLMQWASHKSDGVHSGGLITHSKVCRSRRSSWLVTAVILTRIFTFENKQKMKKILLISWHYSVHRQ